VRRPANNVCALLGYDPTIPTNINLQALLQKHFGIRFSDVYATNALASRWSSFRFWDDLRIG
jgi:hypothetical protein